MQKRVFNSPRLLELKKKRSRLLINKIILSFFLFLFIFVGFGFLSCWTELNIDNVQIKGNKVIEIEEIETLIKKELMGHYLYIFPKTNIVLYPKNQIKNILFDKFKRLKNISLSIDEKTLNVVLTERKAVYTWCGEKLSLDVDSVLNNGSLEKCYFVNEDGYIFDESPYFSGEVYFKFFGSLSNGKDKKNTTVKDNNPIGKYFSPKNFSKFVSFKENVASMGIIPSALFAKEGGTTELYLSSNESPPDAPKIIFKDNANLLKVAQNLKAAIETDPLKSNLEKKYDSLLYIDLRFGNKIYYKFR